MENRNEKLRSGANISVPLHVTLLSDSFPSRRFRMVLSSFSSSATRTSVRLRRCLVFGARKMQSRPIFWHLAHCVDNRLVVCCKHRTFRPRQASQDRFRFCVRLSCGGSGCDPSIMLLTSYWCWEFGVVQRARDVSQRSTLWNTSLCCQA
jgi:hypothetical protein